MELTKNSWYKKLDVDNVISDTFSLYLKNFKTLFLAGFIGIFLIQFGLYEIGIYDFYQTIDPETLAGNLGPFFSKMLLIIGVSILMYALLNVFMINYIFKATTPGENLNISSIFKETVSNYWIHMVFFLILAFLIMMVSVVLGAFIFIIGAFIALVYMGTVLLPGGAIIVTEKKNALDAIGRTFLLVHKTFWPAVGATVLYALIMIFISLVLSALVAIPFVIFFFGSLGEGQSFMDAFNPANLNIGIWAVLINSLTAALTYPITAIFSFLIYMKLKYDEDHKEESV